MGKNIKGVKRQTDKWFNLKNRTFYILSLVFYTRFERNRNQVSESSPGILIRIRSESSSEDDNNDNNDMLESSSLYIR